MLRLRKQRHKAACGLACVSMITNKAYNTIVDDFDMLAELNEEPVEWGYVERGKCYCWWYFTSTYDLHYLLNYYGIKSHKRWSLYTGRDSLSDISILAVNKTKKGWHWVVAEKTKTHVRILDPWRGEGKLNDYRGKVHAYIKVEV